MRTLICLLTGAVALGVILVPDARADMLPGVISSVTPEVSASTLGLGGDLDFIVTGLPIGFRLGGNGFNISHTVKSSDASYEGKIDLASGGLTADWYPLGSGFRLSVGGRYNANQASVTATPIAGSITVNNVSYSTAGSDVSGKVTFPTLAPYAGLGFGSAIFGRLAIGFDLGVMVQGTPKTTLSASGPITGLSGFSSNLAAEQQSLESKIKDYTLYPVVGLSLGWRF